MPLGQTVNDNVLTIYYQVVPVSNNFICFHNAHHKHETDQAARRPLAKFFRKKGLAFQKFHLPLFLHSRALAVVRLASAEYSAFHLRCFSLLHLLLLLLTVAVARDTILNRHVEIGQSIGQSIN